MKSWRKGGNCQGWSPYERLGQPGFLCTRGASSPTPHLGLAPLKRGLCHQERPALQGRGAIAGD